MDTSEEFKDVCAVIRLDIYGVYRIRLYKGKHIEHEVDSESLLQARRAGLRMLRNYRNAFEFEDEVLTMSDLKGEH